MPELPEVETAKRGISPHLIGKTIVEVVIRDNRLRWPITRSMPRRLARARILDVQRRAKYILIETDGGWAIIHLGMSGSLRITNAATPPFIHDHFDLVLSNGKCLRYRDPRRFGCFVWAGENPHEHKLIASLGVEPLSDQCNGDYLAERAHKRKAAVKNFIMDAAIVVGIGNIYASEALFRAGIHPMRAAGRISAKRYEVLTQEIKQTLSEAIKAGGTTLRDFTDDQGRAGYFAHALRVYGRVGEACPVCNGVIKFCVIGQRSSFYCHKCQT